MAYSRINSSSRPPLSINTREYLEASSHYRDKLYHELFQLKDDLESKPKRILWECPHTNDCDIHNCSHYGPHEYIEEDCATGELCSFGIVPDDCVRVGGPKHKQSTEGKCIDIW